MEEIKPNPIFKFNDNQMQEVRQNLGYGDVNKLKQDIEHLKYWIQKQGHYRIKEFGDEYLERLLIYNKGSIERTKQRFDRLRTCTNLMPEFLQNFDIKNEFRHVFNISNTCLLPIPSRDNYRILITNLNGQDDNNFKVLDYYRYLVVLSHYILSNDYCHGYEMVCDSRNITFGTVSKLNPIVIHKAATLIVDGMGKRIKRIHMLSGSKFFDTVLSIIKQALSAKLRQRVVVHSSVESLHEYFSKEQLPKDLGGNERSMKELSDMVFNEMCSDEHIARMKFMEKAGTDESCRLPCKFNEEYSGMPGSFKSLCVD